MCLMAHFSIGSFVSEQKDASDMEVTMRSILKEMTREEKFRLLTGTGSNTSYEFSRLASGRCVSTTAPSACG